jgi:hypothetical protein
MNPSSSCSSSSSNEPEWPKDLPFWNEFKPAKKCWSVLWLCLPKWSSDPILTSNRVRENASGVAQSFEDEDDGEHEDE